MNKKKFRTPLNQKIAIVDCMAFIRHFYTQLNGFSFCQSALSLYDNDINEIIKSSQNCENRLRLRNPS